MKLLIVFSVAAAAASMAPSAYATLSDDVKAVEAKKKLAMDAAREAFDDIEEALLMSEQDGPPQLSWRTADLLNTKAKEFLMSEITETLVAPWDALGAVPRREKKIVMAAVDSCSAQVAKMKKTAQEFREANGKHSY
jgi:hypothetical protein